MTCHAGDGPNVSLKTVCFKKYGLKMPESQSRPYLDKVICYYQNGIGWHRHGKEMM